MVLGSDPVAWVLEVASWVVGVLHIALSKTFDIIVELSRLVWDTIYKLADFIFRHFKYDNENQLFVLAGILFVVMFLFFGIIGGQYIKALSDTAFNINATDEGLGSGGGLHLGKGMPEVIAEQFGVRANAGDIDGDGTPNEFDADMDGDGINNDLDDDIDGDGLPNGVDPNPLRKDNRPPVALCPNSICDYFETSAQMWLEGLTHKYSDVPEYCLKVGEVFWTGMTEEDFYDRKNDFCYINGTTYKIWYVEDNFTCYSDCVDVIRNITDKAEIKHCENGIKDADEEGVDCGGDDCRVCGCTQNIDCEWGYCCASSPCANKCINDNCIIGQNCEALCGVGECYDYDTPMLIYPTNNSQMNDTLLTFDWVMVG